MLEFGDKVMVYDEDAVFIKYAAGISDYAYIARRDETELSMVQVKDIQYMHSTI